MKSEARRKCRVFLAMLTVLVMAIVLMGYSSAFAQTTAGSIVGRVTDSDGAVVVGASVQLRNENTGSVIKDKTNGSGEYTFATVDPGTYDVSITGPGFEPVTAGGIVLDVTQTVRQDVTMHVGKATDVTIEVQSASPVIETDSPTISSLIDSKQIEDTPLNGRDNIFGLLALAPGVQRATTNPLVAGSSFQGGTTATVDGITQNDVFNARVATPIISVDGVAEFRVIGSAAPAQFGRSGSQVVILTKSGANRFHGSLFAFNRNKDLSAVGYFAVKELPPPNFNRNEFGGSIGGPILHNKLFFYFTAEDLRLVQSKAVETTQPTPAMLTGDFSAFQNSSYNPIYNPVTQQVYQNWIIPPGDISPLATYFNQFFPTPNGGFTTQCFSLSCAAVAGTSTTNTDFIYNSPTFEKNFRWSLRGDYQFSDRDHFMLRYYQTNAGPYVAPDLSNSAPLFGNYSGTGTLVKNAAFSYRRIISQNIVNEFVAGYNQEHDPRESQNVGINPGSLIPGVPNAPANHGGLPSIGMYGLSGIADADSDFNNSQHIYQYDDNLTIVHGRHSMMAGAQYIRQRSGQGGEFPGTFTFTGCYSNKSCTGGSTAGSTENVDAVHSFADYLLGDMFNSAAQNTNYVYDATGSSYGIFFQDNWTAMPRLTLNLGLRFEKTFPFGRTVGGLSNFYPSFNAGAGQEVYISGQEDPHLLAEFPQIVNGNTVGIGYHNYYKTQNTDLGPHIGFALRANDKANLVVRGGYALIYNYFAPFINGIGGAPPFVYKTTYQAPSGPVYSATNSSSNPPGVLPNTPSLTWTNPFNNASITGGPAQQGVTPRPKTPYNQQMNLTVEYEFLRNTALRVSYVGNLGTHLYNPDNLNNPEPQPLPAGATNEQPIRPYQPWGAISYAEFNTSTNFNQLQAAVRRRFSDLTLSFDFQLSKGLGLDAFNDSGTTDPDNFRLDYGNLDYYSRLYTVFSHSYLLPFGKGKFFFRKSGRLLDSFIGGWRSTGVLSLYNGLPMSASITSLSTYGNAPSGRPNRIPGISQYNPGVSPAKASMINAQAFCVPGKCPSDGATWTPPTTGTVGFYSCVALACHPLNNTANGPNPATEYILGNEQRNSMYGPGYANYDTNLQKETKLTKRVTLMLRVDAFNALNRTNFATPSNRNITDQTSFGESVAIQGNARELQLSGRLNF